MAEAQFVDVDSLTLRSGAQMPKLGLGLWKLDKAVCADVVYTAIKKGYRLLDGACDYGNEVEVGQGIARAIAEGIVTREDLFIVSKLWNSFHRPEHVELACRKSLSDLGVEYLDMYFIHFPIAIQFVPIEQKYPPEWINNDPTLVGDNPRMIIDRGVTYQQTYQAMEGLKRAGLIKHIGISNVGTSMVREVMAYATEKPDSLQVEMHPFLSQVRLLRMAQEEGMQVMAYSNFGAISYVPLGVATEDMDLLHHSAINAIAAAKRKTSA